MAVNIVQLADQSINLGKGDVGDGTQRICVASDDNLLNEIADSLSDISTKLDTMNTNLSDLLNILNDVWNSTTHKISVSAL